MRALATCLFSLIVVLPGLATADEHYVPEQLAPWVDWVLEGQDHILCPFVGNASHGGPNSRICAWPGELRVEVQGNVARFRQRWFLYREEFVLLPGSTGSWPREVTIDGEAGAIVTGAGKRPRVRLPAGEHEVAGVIEWEARPASFRIPAQAGLVRLTVDGARVASPQRSDDALWLGERPRETAAPETIGVRVYRLLADGLPKMLETRIELEVSGRSREAVLGRALPPGFAPTRFDGQLPTRIDQDGRLRVQVRAGRWVLTLSGRALDADDVVTLDPGEGPWAREEIWSWRPDTSLRVAVPEGLPEVDPVEARVPDQWRSLQAFMLEPGDTFTVGERNSEEKQARENQLHLKRWLWLDHERGGWTAVDTIRGRMQRDWRLDMAAPWSLASVNSSLRNLLITRGPEEGTEGVELRNPEVGLRSVARLEDGDEGKIVGGWQTAFDSLETLVTVPPGHILMHASGADSARGTWLSRWSVLDFFLVLLTAVAVGRLYGLRYGALALIMLVLTWQEFEAPHWPWLAVVAAIATARNAPAGKLRLAATGLCVAALFVLAVQTLPWAGQQARLVLFPQLDDRSPPVEHVPGRILETPTLQAMVPARSKSFFLDKSFLLERGHRIHARSASYMPAAPAANRLSDDVDEFRRNVADLTPATGMKYEEHRQRGARELASLMRQLEELRSRYAAVREGLTRESPRSAGMTMSARSSDGTPHPEVLRLQRQTEALAREIQLAEAQIGDFKRVNAGLLPSAAEPGHRSNVPNWPDGATTNVSERLSPYDPDAVVQAGPGIPDWQGPSYRLFWSGRVTPGEELRLFVLGETGLRLARAAGLLLALVLFLRMAFGAVVALRLRLNGTAAVLPLSAILVALALPVESRAADTFPKPKLLQQLQKRLLAPPACGSGCVTAESTVVDIEGQMLRIELTVHAAEELAVPVPTIEGWQPETVMLDGRPVQELQRRDGQGAFARLPVGIHRIEQRGPIPAVNELRLRFPLVPHRARVNAPHWDIGGLQNGRIVNASLQLTRRVAAATDERTGVEPSQFPSFVRVTRSLSLDVDWRVATAVERIAPENAPFAIDIPLLAGESPQLGDEESERLEVVDGRVRGLIGVGAAGVRWESDLESTASLTLTAPDDLSREEIWEIRPGSMWRVEFEGAQALDVPEMLRQHGAWVTQFRPRPGEQLTIRATRAAGMEGATLAFDRVSLKVTPGPRTTDSELSLAYRSTTSGRHVIGIPDDVRIKAVTMFGEELDVQPENGRLSVPVQPGSHQLEVSWEQDNDGLFLIESPTIDLGAKAANVFQSIDTDRWRWVLFAWGPGQGPAMLFWPLLVLFLVAATVLARTGRAPVRPHELFLLVLGLSTFSWGVLVLVLLWLTAVGWRARNAMPARVERYNAVQIGLALLTIVTVGVLVVSVPEMLLGRPDMSIQAPVAGEPLSWFVDRIDGEIGTATVISLPMWPYRAAILLWMIWLALAVFNWLTQAWVAWSTGGIIRKTPNPPPAPTDNGQVVEGK